jgi:hypothetical protein
MMHIRIHVHVYVHIQIHIHIHIHTNMHINIRAHTWMLTCTRSVAVEGVCELTVGSAEDT